MTNRLSFGARALWAAHDDQPGGSTDIPGGVANEEVVLQYLAQADQPDWEALSAHPSFSEKWVVLFLRRKRVIPAETIREIYNNRQLRSIYVIARALFQCRYTPTALGMNLTVMLRWVDLMQRLRDPHLAGALRHRIENHIMERFPRLALGEKISLARQAPRPLIRHLRMVDERPVIQALLQNSFFTYDDAVFIVSYSNIGKTAVEELARSNRWNHFKDIKCGLLKHPHVPRSAIPTLALGLTEVALKRLLVAPKITTYARAVIRRILDDQQRKRKGPRTGKRF